MMQALLAAAVEIGRGFFNDWKARREDKRQVERAVTENRIRLAQSAQEHNQEWEMRALEGRDNWLRRLSFGMWSAPLLWAYFDPAGARAYFTESLAGLPEWYVGGYLAITGAVWGLVELKAAGVLRGRGVQ